jgi:DNA segregation ATPase FtsK/SpoIIIE-like protein
MKAKNLASFNSKVQKKLPRLLCVVDEMATLVGIDLTEEIHTELRVLSAQGRAVGINLVLCTQHSSVDVLPGWVKTNMSLRISAKMPSHQASMIILDSVTAATIDNIPGRMVFSSGRFETIAQSPYITDNEVETVVLDSNQYSVVDNQEFESSLPEPVKRFGRDDVLKMCIEQFNGQLSYMRVHDVVGNEVAKQREIRAIVDSIKDELVRVGHIEFDDVRYTIEKKRRSYYLVQLDSETIRQNDSPEDSEKFVSLDVSLAGD